MRGGPGCRRGGVAAHIYTEAKPHLAPTSAHLLPSSLCIVCCLSRSRRCNLSPESLKCSSILENRVGVTSGGQKTGQERRAGTGALNQAGSKNERSISRAA